MVVLDLKTVRIEGGGGGRSRVLRVYGVTFSGSYANSGTTGEALDFTNTTTFTNPDWIARALFSRNPSEYAVLNHPAGWEMKIEPGTAPATGWGLRLFQSAGSAAPLAELANGAYPASITGSVGIRVSFAQANL